MTQSDVQRMHKNPMMGWYTHMGQTMVYPESPMSIVALQDEVGLSDSIRWPACHSASPGGEKAVRERNRASCRSMGEGDSQMPIGVGVGIHTGTVAAGEVGEACRDFTAVGSVVNLASRLQGAAGPGEVLVTEPVYERVAKQFPNAPKRVCQLKGLEQLVDAWVLKPRV